MRWLKGLTAQAQDDSHLLVRVTLQSHAIVSCLIAISRACLPNPVNFPTLLETELGTNCVDPRGRLWFGRTAEQSPLTKVTG